MVHVILDTYIEGSTEREIHIRYDRDIANDKLIMDKINQILIMEQPLCCNCANYYKEGYFCGYCASSCKIHGNIEAWDHPHRDGDGSKCPDYTPKGNDETVKPKSIYVSKYSESALSRYLDKLNELKRAKSQKEVVQIKVELEELDKERNKR